MATYEIYVGGPSTNNASLAMFPAKTFAQGSAPFNKPLGVAAHKGPIGFADTRLLDFGADRALQEFARSNAVVQGDKLGVVLIPKNHLFLGWYFKNEVAVPGLTVTPSTRVGGLAWPTIDCNVVAEGFYGPTTGATLVTAGVVTEAGAYYNINSDMLDLTLTAMNAVTKFGSLKLTISPVLLASYTGGTR